MQEGGDRLVLVGAVLEGEARDAEDMGDVGDGRPLADLAGVQSGGQHEGILKTRRQGHRTPPRSEPGPDYRTGLFVDISFPEALRALHADRPLVSPSGDLDGEAPVAERGDDQAAACVGGIRLGMAAGAEGHQAVEIEVRAPLGALDDVIDLERAPAGAPGRRPPDRRPLHLPQCALAAG